RRIRRVVVCGGGAAPCTPCGGCRQKIREFAAAETPVIMVSPAGERLLERTLSDLLPDSFGPGNLLMGRRLPEKPVFETSRRSWGCFR
ncbi:cytidine deaminase family protein, partial [Komagataeibacter kakiaceti]|uniref:cytidine deaminase family protein n=1 Tax=Komagataeibacter kakiaceti TaxID=943261 RepID=UPI000470BE7B